MIAALLHSWVASGVVAAIGAAIGVTAGAVAVRGTRKNLDGAVAAWSDVSQFVHQPEPWRAAVIASRSNVALCSMWERSGRAMRPTPFVSTLNRCAQLRGQLLDELERRDPAVLGKCLNNPNTVTLRRYLSERAHARGD